MREKEKQHREQAPSLSVKDTALFQKLVIEEMLSSGASNDEKIRWIEENGGEFRTALNSTPDLPELWHNNKEAAVSEMVRLVEEKQAKKKAA